MSLTSSSSSVVETVAAEQPSGEGDLPPRGNVFPGWPLCTLLALGLLTSLGLQYVHWATYYRPSDSSFCSVGVSFDCAAVAASRWSIFLGVPWAAWGALGYGTLLWAAFKRSVWLLPLAALAALVSLWLLGVSLFVVHSVCLLCEITHIVSWLVLALVLRRRTQLGSKWNNGAHVLDVLLPPTGVGLALVVFFPAYWDAFSYKGAPPFATGVTEEGYAWIGAREPKVTIHEFVDYSCGHCKVHAAHTLRALRRHPDIRIVRRHQPRMRCLDQLPGSCSHVRMAYCAEEQGKFWQADRWLFAHAKAGLVEPNVPEMARDLQLDEHRLAQCVRDKRAFERARREARITNQAKIRSVPAYMIDGKRVKPAEVNALLR